jgi:hypothetical protein
MARMVDTCQREVPGCGKPLGLPTHHLVEPKRLVDHDHPRPWARSRRLHQNGAQGLGSAVGCGDVGQVDVGHVVAPWLPGWAIDAAVGCCSVLTVEPSEDLVDVLGPGERLAALVPAVTEPTDRCDQLFPDQVEPGGVGRVKCRRRQIADGLGDQRLIMRTGQTLRPRH